MRQATAVIAYLSNVLAKSDCSPITYVVDFAKFGGNQSNQLVTRTRSQCASASGQPACDTFSLMALCPAQSLQGLEKRGQGFFPWAPAYEGGFYLWQGERGAGVGEQLCDGADLFGQGGGPGCWAGCGALFFGLIIGGEIDL